MSDASAVTVAGAPIGIAAAVAAAAAAVPLAVGYAGYRIGKEMLDASKDVFRMCKDGRYPIERMSLVSTDLSNFVGLSDMLRSEGFTLNNIETGICSMEALTNTAAPVNSCSSLKGSELNDLARISVAKNDRGDSLFLIDTGSGIGFVSENTNLISSTVQNFVTSEITSMLQDSGFTVAVEKKGGEKVIRGTDKEKNRVEMKICKGEHGESEILIDTRPTKKRPKCDIIHQTIKQKLGERMKRSSQNDTNRKRTTRKTATLKVGRKNG